MAMANHLSPEEEASLLQVAAFHHRDLDRITFRSSPREEKSVEPFMVDVFPTQPTSTHNSFLGRLPLELLRAVCLDLDIRSLFCLRQVNRLARQVVSGLGEYQAVSRYALDALRASLLTRMARYQTLEDIYDVLCEPACAFCPSFGSFLFLPAATRCCYHCLKTERALGVDRAVPWLSASVDGESPNPELLEGQLADPSKDLASYPKADPLFRFIPGTYTAESIRIDDRSGSTWAELSNRRWIAPHLIGRTSKLFALPYAVSTAFPYFDRFADEVHYGLSCRGCWKLKKRNKEIDDLQESMHRNAPAGLQGPMARLWDIRVETRQVWDEVYTREGVLEHVKECEAAQKIWRAKQLKDAGKSGKA